MEMNVCNANTNWLRGEQDCTKDSKKNDKKRKKKKRSGKLGCMHIEHTCI